MNRLDLMQTGVRTEFPASLARVMQFDVPVRRIVLAPLTRFYLAVAGFMGCGAILIATAILIALRIH